MNEKCTIWVHQKPRKEVREEGTTTNAPVTAAEQGNNVTNYREILFTKKPARVAVTFN